MERFGTSHAKIILMGEHSVVYGQPAIAFPLKSVQIRVDIKSNPDVNYIRSEYFNGEISDMPAELLGIKRLIQAELQIMRADSSQHFTMQINSAIPSERGMGSSAATAIAISRSLANFFNYELTHSELLQIANIEETITHGSPSGIDTATASSNLPVWFIPQKTNQVIPMNINGFMVIADSGIKGHTDVAVNSVRQTIQHDPTAKVAIEQLGSLTTKTRDALSDGDINSIGSYMSQAQQCLKQLGVSIPIVDRLINVAMKNGSLGAKLTGSGLGGCIVAITDDSNVAKHIAQALEKAGAVQTWIEKIEQ